MYALLQCLIAHIGIGIQHAGILHPELVGNSSQTLQHHPKFLILAYESWIIAHEILHQATQQQVIALLQGTEVEKLGYTLLNIELLQRSNLLLRRRNHTIVVRIDGTVADDGRTRQRAAEHHSLQRFATAQRHIGLTMGKGSRGVNDGMFEGKSLTLVDSDGPCQSNGILSEGALHGFLYLLRLLIECVFRVAPFCLFQYKLFAIVLSHDPDLLVINSRHLAYHTIIEPVVSIVLDKHNLSSLLQQQLEIGRIGRLGEVALHLCRETIYLRG